MMPQESVDEIDVKATARAFAQSPVGKALVIGMIVAESAIPFAPALLAQHVDGMDDMKWDGPAKELMYVIDGIRLAAGIAGLAFDNPWLVVAYFGSGGLESLVANTMWKRTQTPE